jgi:hypothetical protein
MFALVPGKALQMMNRAFEEDPNAVHTLICNRVPCNMKLADDETIIVEQCQVLPDIHAQVGLLGFINGLLCECGCDEVLAAKFKETAGNKKELIGFTLVGVDKVIK